MSPRVRLVVLDLAGTTIEDSTQVATAFAEALAQSGVAVSAREIAGVRGAAKREAIARLIPPGTGHAQRSAAAYDAFTRLLRQAYAGRGMRPIVGAADALWQLRARGIRVALNTGFERCVAEPLLAALNWDTAADALVFGDDVNAGRPAPFMIFRAMELTGVTAVEQVANVGDTTLDLQAGRNAGVQWNIGVLTGAHGRRALSDAPHTHLLRSVADLPALLR